MDQLLSAFPEWSTATPQPDDSTLRTVSLILKGDERSVTATAPEINEIKFDAVLSAHDSTAPSFSELQRDQIALARITASSKLRGLGFSEDEIKILL